MASFPHTCTGLMAPTVTVEQLTQTFPTFTLKLRAKEVSEIKGSQDTTYYKQAKQQIKSIYQNIFAAKEELNLKDQRADPETTAANQAKLNAIFKEFHLALAEMEKDANDQMRNMSREQQEDILMYWASVGKFLAEVLTWLKKAFDYVIEKMREGFKIVKESVQFLFDTLADLFKEIF